MQLLQYAFLSLSKLAAQYVILEAGI